jgi:putative sigma-54 modulation protein
MNNHELIISGRHLELTESLKYFVREKTDKLFRHEERIVRIRVELDVDKQTKETVFIAKGIIEINGPDMIASESSDEMHKSIDLLIGKLDRMIRRRSRLKKVKRNHPHSIELPSSLPKVAPA